MIDTITTIIEKFAGKSPTADAHLFDEGYLDSLSFLGLVEELESHFNVRMTAEFMNEENFSTLEKIEKTIAQIIKSQHA
ncbi:MAG: acyl carrier protein [Arenicellaceae bacterium]|nr:acyl carrier protein [Arenicellaceae bacterium]